ncbi:unnamed protein product, partial [Protopolystoma xenopodis]
MDMLNPEGPNNAERASRWRDNGHTLPREELKNCNCEDVVNCLREVTSKFEQYSVSMCQLNMRLQRLTHRYYGTGGEPVQTIKTGEAVFRIGDSQRNGVQTHSDEQMPTGTGRHEVFRSFTEPSPPDRSILQGETSFEMFSGDEAPRHQDASEADATCSKTNSNIWNSRSFSDDASSYSTHVAVRKQTPYPGRQSYHCLASSQPKVPSLSKPVRPNNQLDHPHDCTSYHPSQEMAAN